MHLKSLKRLAILQAAALFACGTYAQTAIKVGFLGELSGSAAAVGQDQLDGFNLLVEQNGGKLGGVPVQLVKEDSQMKPDVAMQAVRRLVDHRDSYMTEDEHARGDQITPCCSRSLTDCLTLDC